MNGFITAIVIRPYGGRLYGESAASEMSVAAVRTEMQHWPHGEATAGRQRARMALYCLLAASLKARAAGAEADTERLTRLIGAAGAPLHEVVASARAVAVARASELAPGDQAARIDTSASRSAPALTR